MPTLAHHLFTLACNNAWSNLRLHRACAHLSPDDLVAPRTSFFPSIRLTLNHLLTVDWLYVDALERALDAAPPHPEPASFFTPTEPFTALADLTAAQRAVDLRLIAATRRLDARLLAAPVPIRRRAGVVAERADRLLAHVFTHQTHHRGQVHAMLAGTSLAPPQLDEFFCANEAHLRADELAELGLTEADVWPPGA